MFPLPISSYLMIGLAVIAMAGVGYGRYEHNAFEEYKAEEIKNAREKEHQMQDATDQIRKDKDAQINVCNNKSICRGDTTILTATGGQSYIWNTGETTSNIIVHPLNTTTYTVNINTPIGCTINRFITVFIKNPVINLGKDSILCIGETKLLNATCPNAVYSWQDGSTQPTYLAIKDTIYWVKVTDTTNNCSSIALITLIECNKELIIPNIITPNGDGYNDYFVIKDSYVWKLSVQIYNRWGVKVYENDNYQNNWDGKLNGKNLADGVYYYIIKAKNKNDNKEKQYHGSLTILR